MTDETRRSQGLPMLRHLHARLVLRTLTAAACFGLEPLLNVVRSIGAHAAETRLAHNLETVQFL